MFRRSMVKYVLCFSAQLLLQKEQKINILKKKSI